MIVQLQRLSDGKRRVTSIAEITGMEGDIIQMQEIFKFVRTGTAADGTVEGHFAGDRRAPALPGRAARRGASRFPAAISIPASRCRQRHAVRISIRST